MKPRDAIAIAVMAAVGLFAKRGHCTEDEKDWQIRGGYIWGQSPGTRSFTGSGAAIAVHRYLYGSGRIRMSAGLGLRSWLWEYGSDWMAIQGATEARFEVAPLASVPWIRLSALVAADVGRWPEYAEIGWPMQFVGLSGRGDVGLSADLAGRGLVDATLGARWTDTVSHPHSLVWQAEITGAFSF